MRLHFHIRYKARWGESLCILGEASPIICWTENQPLRMQCRGEEDWHAETELPDSIRQISYHYAVLQNDGRYLHEQKPIRNVLSDSAASCLFLNDYWQEADIERIFASAVFAGVFFARGQQKTFGTTKPSKTKKPASPIEENLSANTKHLRLRLHLFAAQIEPDQGLAVVGNIPELGEWETARKQALSDQHYPNWQIELPIGTPQKSIEYKYVVYRLADGEILDYENGENRRIEITGQESLVRCQDFGFRRTKAAWKGAGTAIPVFSLRSRQSFGIGEFPDLKILGEWAVATRQKIIQTLPVNDTTLYHNRHDSYPYNAVSVMALNPNYLNIEKMGKLPTKMLRQYRKTQSELNAKSFVDYQVVADEKKHYFLYLYRQESNKLFASEAYRVFWEKNREWLKTYAAFSYLRDRFGTPDFRQWPRYSRYYADEIEALCAPESEAYKDIAFYYFLQFHADAQLTEAKNHLRRLCIALKGDIPIGISPDSVEAWSRPEEFNLNCQAGAPPDEFSISGQNWGFPTYNWDIMARNHYEWWRKRFLKMAEYFDAFRIDHILGFFRIWEMSTDEVWGLKGRFSPALPYTGEELRHQGICMDTERPLSAALRSAFRARFTSSRQVASPHCLVSIA